LLLDCLPEGSASSAISFLVLASGRPDTPNLAIPLWSETMGSRLFPLGVVALCGVLVASATRAADMNPEQREFFEKQVRPLLVEHCYRCHSAEGEQKGHLMLDTKAGWEVGGESGSAIVPGKPDDSLLIEAVRYESFEMPPEKQLSEEQIAILVKWVSMGAPDPRLEGGPTASRTIDLDAARQKWPFAPPVKSEPPQVKNKAWTYTDIDHFLLARQEQAGVEPVADADRLSLLRRVTFDLTGLPPTPEEMDAFVQDSAPTPKALERVVDRLLESPQYGERWGRHWLDVARYADSVGRNPLSYAWQYRNYVIDSFNADKPYDQFVREQIAGDLLAQRDGGSREDLIIATGFLALGDRQDGQRDEVVDEQIDCTGKAFLGITVACARCHDHKFDPIPTEDYYAMAGIFRSTDVRRSGQNNVMPVALDGSKPEAYKAYAEKLDKFRKEMVRKMQDAERERDRAISTLRAAEARYRNQPEDKPRPEVDRAQQALDKVEQKYQQVRKQFEAGRQELRKMQPRLATGVEEGKKPADQPLYIRGDSGNRGDVVPRGFVQVATHNAAHEVQNKQQSGRLELAEWIASPQNPMTARVMANRVWYHLFGQGIVPTVDNFGAMGEPPSHPELLDYLAVQFMEDGGSVKRLIRRIALSHAYQLSTVDHPRNQEIDGDNHLVWRMNRRRLEAEALRDALLTFSGSMDLQRPETSQFLEPSYQRIDFEQPCRSVYLPVMRDGGFDLFGAFDGADASMVVGKREVSVVPPQALYLLNSPLVMNESRRAAERLLGREDLDDAARIDWAYRLAFSRPATDTDRQLGLAFVEKYRQVLEDEGKATGDVRLEVWTRLCQALVASAEFQILN